MIETNRVNDRLTSVDAATNDKITKMAQNTDFANDIQRQVLEALDKRIEALECTGDKEKAQVKEFTYRAVEAEIKIEKLCVAAEEIAVKHEKVRKMTE